MIKLNNGYLAGTCYLKNAYEAVADGEKISINGIHNVPPFYSNSIVFLGKMGHYEVMEESTYTPPKVEKYEKELHILDADDLPTESTTAETGGQFVPILQFEDTLAVVLPTRKITFSSGNGMMFMESKVQDSTIQANVTGMDEDSFEDLKNSEMILIAGESPFVNKPGRHIMFMNAFAEAVE